MAKGKLSVDMENNKSNNNRGYNNDFFNNYGTQKEKEKDEEEEEEKGGRMDKMRMSFGETLFNNNNPTSPNLSNMATMSHKQVISVV